MGASNYVHLEGCTVKRVTEKAMLVTYREEDVWLPLSQVADGEDFEEGDEDVTISVTEWIVGEKGLDVE